MPTLSRDVTRAVEHLRLAAEAAGEAETRALFGQHQRALDHLDDAQSSLSVARGLIAHELGGVG